LQIRLAITFITGIRSLPRDFAGRPGREPVSKRRAGARKFHAPRARRRGDHQLATSIQ